MPDDTVLTVNSYSLHTDTATFSIKENGDEGEDMHTNSTVFRGSHDTFAPPDENHAHGDSTENNQLLQELGLLDIPPYVPDLPTTLPNHSAGDEEDLYEDTEKTIAERPIPLKKPTPVVAQESATWSEVNKPMSNENSSPIDFERIYRQASIATSPLSAEQLLELLDSLPATMSDGDKASMAKAWVNTLGKSLHISHETIADEADRKMTAINEHLDNSSKQVDLLTAGHENRIAELRTQIESLQAEVEAVREEHGHSLDPYSNEYDRLKGLSTLLRPQSFSS